MAVRRIVEDIINGTATMDDVVRSNVAMMDRWIDAGAKHPAAVCNNKNCIHGPREMDIEHRNTIAREVGIPPRPVVIP